MNWSRPDPFVDTGSRTLQNLGATVDPHMARTTEGLDVRGRVVAGVTVFVVMVERRRSALLARPQRVKVLCPLPLALRAG
jgi:hypothetical protein